MEKTDCRGTDETDRHRQKKKGTVEERQQKNTRRTKTKQDRNSGGETAGEHMRQTQTKEDKNSGGDRQQKNKHRQNRKRDSGGDRQQRKT